MIKHYEVSNKITGAVKIAKTRIAARRIADKWDAGYGAYISTVRPVFA